MGKSGDMKDPMLRGVMHLREQDEVIDRIAEEHGNPGFPGSYTPFESMVRAILSQQISGAAARTIIGRVEAVAGGITTPESVAMLSADELRRCGVSAQKSRYLASLIDHVDRGLIDFDTIARLEVVPWSRARMYDIGEGSGVRCRGTLARSAGDGFMLCRDARCQSAF